MAIEPHRFRALSSILDERVDKIHGDNSPLVNGKTIAALAELEQISPHFNSAFDLMERQGRRFNYATGSIRHVDADTRPSALIAQDGKIIHANLACEKLLGFKKDKTTDSHVFEHGDNNRLSKDLRQLANQETDKVIAVYTLYMGEKQTPTKMALSKTIGYNGAVIGRLCTFHIKWLPEMESQFQKRFNLTPIEIEITRAIVSGITLGELANKRGRSLETLRKQTKRLLAKLNLRSQVELACIYSGFTQFNLKDASDIASTRKKTESWKQSHKLKLADNRILHYETCGPEQGRPVLYFHGLMGGNVMTKAMCDQLTTRNIYLIMVWRPHFAKTSPDHGPLRKANARFALDIETLLDHLKIETCQILANIAGAIYAYGCAQHMPNRILGIVNTAGSIPLQTQRQFKLMSKPSRVSLYVARHTPNLLPMLLRAMLAKVDAGFDEEFIQEHYADSPPDQKVMQEPELKSLIRDQFPLLSRQGYTHMSRDIHTQARKWGSVLEGVTCPVTLVHGDSDPAYPLCTVEDFVKTQAEFKLAAIPSAGQLVLYQAHETVFTELDKQFSERKP